MKKHFVLFFLAAGIYGAMAQQPARPAVTGNLPGGAPQGPVKASPKPYRDVITDKAVSSHGLFTVHRLDDKIYFELADSVLNRDILLVSRLSKSAADMRGGNGMVGYAGDMLNRSVMRFEKGPANRLFVREMSYSERSADSTQAMYKTVLNSNIQPIVLSFDIRAYHTDSVTGIHSTVIELTELVNGDNDLFFFGSSKGKFSITAYQPDKSYVLDIKTFPINTEIKTVKTYTRSGNFNASFNGVPQSATISAKPATVELNTSLVLLPAQPMQARYADDRVGYFTSEYTDFDANPQGVKKISVIERWRLEPRREDMGKYGRGELVEPQKPIVIYIDPATPAKWVPYLIQGINDWQPAFEKAGFKNAIIGKKAPTPQEDPSWSLDDARNSAVVYKPSPVANASGPHITDPRSGEVIETHINWYHNIMKLVHDWYMIQAAAVDPGARNMQFSDSLMGQLIRFVSSHEVGHTLGLRHNFGASSATPVEKLRDKAWVEAHGHTSSIMDYARFNYVAQPEDNITEAGLFPRIGDYDKWAIEWGYHLVPGTKNAGEERTVLNQWIMAHSNDKRYWFGNESDPDDPRSQSEDLGDNAMKAGAYGIKNLRRILPRLVEWTREANSDYDNLQVMYRQLNSQLSLYIGHVVKYIGGSYENLKTVEQPGAVYSLVPAALQQEAVAFLNAQVFTTPEWLVDNNVLSRIGVSPAAVIGSLQNESLSRVMSPAVFNKLLVEATIDPHAYSMTDLLAGLRKGIWNELDTRQPISFYRRNLQTAYVEKLIAIVLPFTGAKDGPAAARGGDNADLVAIAKAELKGLKEKIRLSLPGITDSLTRYHLQDVLERITNAIAVK